MKEENAEFIEVHGSISYNWFKAEQEDDCIERESESDWELFIDDILKRVDNRD